MKKIIAAFVSGGTAGAVALAIATGLLFGGGSSNADVELAASAPEIPGQAQTAAKGGDPAVVLSVVPVSLPAEAPAPAPVVEPEPVFVDTTSHFGVNSSQSTAKIIAYQTGLLGDSAAVGTGNNVTGEIFLTQTGALGATPSWLQIDMRTLRSGDAALSAFLKNDLQASKFPAGLFSIERVDGIPANYTDGNEFSFRMSGPLTMHGRTNYVTWSVKARQSGDFLTMAADTDFNLTDFGWTPPDYGIARAKNGVHLQVIVLAGRIN